MHIFGILNITEDSFSDGGVFLDSDAALAHAQNLTRDGADVIDIGAAASNPDARPVPHEIEIARLAKLIPALQKRGIAVSVDSFATPTQAWALTQNIDYLNDVNGFADATLYDALAAASARLIVMHATPPPRRDTPADTIIDEIKGFFDARLTALIKAGIKRERLIIDPGMGRFLRDTPQASLRVLNAIPELASMFELPVMISLSRKQFLQVISGCAQDNIAPLSLAGELYAINAGASYIRTHEVAQLFHALKLHNALAENVR